MTMDEQASLSAEEIEPIAPEEARKAIERAMIAHLGEDWRKTWLLVHESNFLVRLNQGAVNLDFQAGLLGEVEITEKPAHPLQLSGKMVAWSILLASVFVALSIALVLKII